MERKARGIGSEMSSYLQQGHDVFSKVVLREIILPRLLSLTRESRKAQGMSQGLAVKRDGHDVPGERLAVSSRAVAGVAVKSHESDSLMKQDTRQAQGCPDES